MSQDNPLIIPPSFPPQQAQSLTLEWLKANPVAPLDIASVTIHDPQIVLVPLTFVSAGASATFSGHGSYEERDAPIISQEDEPVERQRTAMSASGQAQGRIQGWPISRVQELPSAPVRMDKTRVAQPDELNLLRMRANLVDGAWDERIRREVEGSLRADAEGQIRNQAPRDANNVSVDEVRLDHIQFSLGQCIDAWTAFYHLRYQYQNHSVDVLVDGQSRALYGQQIISTMRQWEAQEKSRKRTLVQLILVALFSVILGPLVVLFISNSPDANMLVIGLVALLFIGVYIGLFNAIRGALQPNAKPESDEARREGQDIAKLLPPA